jgi:hypothetical protein
MQQPCKAGVGIHQLYMHLLVANAIEYDQKSQILKFWICVAELKWYLHMRENIIHCHYHQQWQFEKMGEFL